MPPLPARVLGTYFACWPKTLLIRKLHPAYNVVFLAFATPVGGPPGSTGAVEWSQDAQTAATFFNDLQARRLAGTCVILSVGGAGNYIRLDTAARSTAFVQSIESIYDAIGGFDGVDFDIEGGNIWASQLVSIATQLKARYGAGFVITYPPAPWSPGTQQVTRVLYQAHVLDLVSPQYHDPTRLWSEARKVAEMIYGAESIFLPLVGGDASKLGLGYGISAAIPETMTIASFIMAHDMIRGNYPALRGCFSWHAQADAARNWSFASQAGPLT